MKDHSSAITRIGIAITRNWQEMYRAQELLLRRPWEAEEEMRWVSGASGPRLTGTTLPRRLSP